MKKKFLALAAFVGILFTPVHGYAHQEHKKPILVFDFGGVIAQVDSSVLPTYVGQALHLSPSEVNDVLNALRVSRAKGVSEEEFWKEYAETTKITLPEKWTENLEIIKQSAVQPIPRMVELVKTLRSYGYRIAVLSNVQKHQAKIVRDKGLYLYFDPLVLSCEIGVEKPKIEAFQILLQRLTAAPQECILIDDSLENIQAAQQIGIHGILFQSYESLQAELKRRNIPDLSNHPKEGLSISIRSQ